MSNFTDLCYANVSGMVAPVDPSYPDNPYFGNTKLAKNILTAGMRAIQWTEENGRKIVIKFQSRPDAILDRKSGLLLVVVHFNDSQFPRPSNAVAFKPSGEIDHIITPPFFAELEAEQTPLGASVRRRFPVEAFTEVLIKNGRVLFGLNFNYEWIERRYYDAAIRE